MRVFVLTGAGVSAESGLGTFRDPDGLWTRVDLQEVATPEGFARDPAKVHAFYNARREGLLGARPNAAHAALARLEAGLAARGGALFLCTQNIDDLHEKAGSRRVTHMHGELGRIRCAGCGAVVRWSEPLSTETACPVCGVAGELRPHVVWFGEMPLEMDEIAAALAQADLFVAIGTSGAVYPAAGFVADARALGVCTVEINLAPSDNAWMFDELICGPASEAVPTWVDSLLGDDAPA
jgi:NAD-dependent deacetylase